MLTQFEELAYYVVKDTLEPIEGNFIFSELINPIFAKKGENTKVHVYVAFIDQNTELTVISEYNLIIIKKGTWKLL